MNDLETRELEYFLLAADELHFGRAAVRLPIAQPALSKAIRRIETRLGVPLLIRTSRLSNSLRPARRSGNTADTRSTRSAPPSAPPSHLVLAWNEHDHRPMIASFVAAARKAAPVT